MTTWTYLFYDNGDLSVLDRACNGERLSPFVIRMCKLAKHSQQEIDRRRLQLQDEERKQYKLYKVCQPGRTSVSLAGPLPWCSSRLCPLLSSVLFWCRLESREQVQSSLSVELKDRKGPLLKPWGTPQSCYRIPEKSGTFLEVLSFISKISYLSWGP